MIWSHNDSGQPLLHAVDASGPNRGRVRIPNATVEDWEDVSVAACRGGSCLYVADVTAGLYRFPTPLRAGAAMTPQRVTSLPLRRVTDAETSSDGAWVAVRTNDAVVFLRAADLTSVKPQEMTVSLRGLKEPQGEGVAIDANGLVYLTGEGPRAGTLNMLRCTLPK